MVLILFVLIFDLIIIYFSVRRVILLLRSTNDEDTRQDSIVIIRDLLTLITLISCIIPVLSVLFDLSDDWIYIIIGMSIFIIIMAHILLLVIERVHSQIQNK